MRVLMSVVYGTEEVPITVNQVNITKQEGIQSNSMSIHIDNINECIINEEIRFEEGEQIKVFAKNDYIGGTLDTSTASPDLLFIGTIKSIKLKMDDKFRCTLDCVDTTYTLLNKLWGKFYEDSAPDIVLNVVKFGAFTGEGTYIIETNLDNTIPYTGGIQNKRPDGSAFPVVKLGKSHKPIFEFIDEVSQTNYTNSVTEINNKTTVCNRPFKYYIDSTGEFHWFYPTDTPDLYMTYGATSAVSPDTVRHRIISEDLEYSNLGETNFIIYKAGEDMDNVQILNYHLNPATKSLTTADSFRNWEDIARVMKQQDIGNITFLGGDEYDYPSSYPVTPAWDTQGRSVADDDEYNDNFREEANRIARTKCESEFNGIGNRWSGKLTIHGENLEPTDLIKYTRTKYGFSNLLLRIKSVNHTINKDSFITTLNIKEDIPEVI